MAESELDRCATPGGYGGGSGYGQGGGSYRAAGAIARDAAPPKIMPIASLNSYQNHWTVRARVTHKSDVRRYSNARGEGARLFWHSAL